MKLWLLRPVGGVLLTNGAYEVPCGWCKPYRQHLRGLVVQADTEVAARALAHRLAVSAWAHESFVPPHDPGGPAEIPAWSDPARSTCVELAPGSHAQVVITEWADG